MAGKLFKSRAGLAIVIPQAVADRYHLTAGVEIEITPIEEGILLEPIGVEPWFSIEWEQALDFVVEQYRPALEELRG
jgi:bifunctional DNA-binding transcriptional regulator/antitoxin component of YhaV-PrlF toxin-antitoxin module